MKPEYVVKDILKKHNITSWYQPIVNLESRTVIGWEAFSRGPETNDSLGTHELFDTAAEAGILKPFDLMCIHNAALCFEQLQLGPKLFLNFTNEMLVASSKLKKQLGNMIADSAIPPARMVLEIDEKNASQNPQDLISAVNYFHEMGFEIAFDHLSGMGDVADDSALHALWAELKPEYIKLDQGFIKEINGSITKQKTIKKLVAKARSLGAQLIAKGVETEKELCKLYELGVYAVQGYVIQKPELAPVPPDLEQISQAYLSHSTNQGSLASDLVVSTTSVESQTSIQHVFELFEQNVHLSSLAVVEEQIVLGMVHRRVFMTKYAKKQRREVVQHKPITHAMTVNCLKVEADQRIEQVSRLVTTRAQINAEHDFVICNQGRFLGIGTVIDLLRKITQLRVLPDHQQNILTMLPGNTPLGSCVNELLDGGKPFSVALLDLSNFKAFNNLYSHYEGDQMLIMFAELLRKHTKTDANIAGHIGGDDFVLIMPKTPWITVLGHIFKEFEHKAQSFYSEKDLAQGCMMNKDVQGHSQAIDLVTLSASVLSIDGEYFDDFSSVLKSLIKLKPMTKSAEGICLVHRSGQEIEYFARQGAEFESKGLQQTDAS